MKVTHILTVDSGGAANSCIRLHLGLLSVGVNSKVLVLKKTRNSTFHISELDSDHFHTNSILKSIETFLIRLKILQKDRKLLHRLLLKNKPIGFEPFSFPDTKYDISEHKLYKEADIINIHWAANFLDYDSFFKKNTKPVIWTLHDMNPFTGGCHYSGTCTKFKFNCKKCPQLKGTICQNYSNVILRKKFNSLTYIKTLYIVAPSRWLLNESLCSYLFNSYPHFHIPYGVNKDIYSPINSSVAKQLLGINEDKKVVLFVADYIDNPRKGFAYLATALKTIKTKNLILLTVGAGSLSISNHEVINMGYLRNDYLMKILYSAADLFVIPSLEDNLPNTALESLMCGTPIVGFNVGGIKEIIDNNVNGILCDEINADCLSSAIEKITNNDLVFNRDIIRSLAVSKYELSIQASEYKKLYTAILSSK